ncbi:MAG: ABC transporter permease [Pirellulales bacterium]
MRSSGEVPMRALSRKRINELWNLRWQSVAICLVLASGVATFVLSLTTLDSLIDTRTRYYASANFGHVFASLKRAPRALEARLREVPGVQDLETRIVVPALLDVPGMSEPATACLVSLPDFQEPRINRLYLRLGRYPVGDRRGEALVSEAFASAHGLQPGDQIRAIIHGRYQTLTLTGIALSPEYIYSVRSGELLPDDRRFGVFWLPYRDLAAAWDLNGAFNDVTATLRGDVSAEAVLRQLDELLLDYGGGGAFGRENQSSYRFLENELIQLRGMALLPPAIFLAVTAFLLQVVLSRIVAQQREQIASLRAFGYTQFEVQRHYLSLAVVLIAVGSLVGVAAGLWLGRDLTELYARFFRFPEFRYQADPVILLAGVGGSAVCGLLATWRTVRLAVSVPPATAMQPEPPARYRPSLVEQLGLQRWLSPAARMVLRHLELQPFRSLLTSLGISLAIAILVLGNSTEDTIDFVMAYQFELAHRQNVTVSLVEPSSGRSIHDLRHLPGVLRVEPFRAVPIRLRHGHHWRRLGLLGVSSQAELFRVLDADGRPVVLPPDGLVLSRQLADILGCQAGDEIVLEVLEGARPVRYVAVSRVIDDFIDLNAYMDLDALRRLLREQETASGAYLAVDPAVTETLYRQLKQLPRVASVALQQALLESYRRTLAENVLRMRAINLTFAIIVALGVVYNAARVLLSERSREMATLRVLGFSRRETSAILLGELAVLVVVAIPLGIVCGYALVALLTWTLSTEVHRFPVIVSSGTFALAVVITLGAALGSALVVRRHLDRLELVSVLKARD